MRAIKLLRRDPAKPTLRERAASLKATAGRVMGKRSADQPSPETLPSGSVVDQGRSTFTAAARGPHHDSRQLSNEPNRDDADDRGEHSLESAMGRHETFDFSIPLPEGLLSSSSLEAMRIHDLPEPALRMSAEAVEAMAPHHEAFDLHSEGTPTQLDATLLALEAQFIEAHRVTLDVSGGHDAAHDKLVEPEMPTELRVWQNDWVYNSIPRPDLIPLANGRARQRPYGLKEVEILRSRPCTCAVIGGTIGTPLPGGGREKLDPIAQARADDIVAAWDRWQAEIYARKEALNLFDSLARVREAEDRRLGILRQVRAIPAQSLAGLGVKARVAFALSSGLNPKEAGARSYDADEFEAFVFDLAGDALVVASDTSVAQPGNAAAAPTASETGPAHDLSACTLPQLARLYETWESVFEHLTGAGDAPCFLDSDKNYNPAGEVLDQEYHRAGHFLSAIADEAAKRTPVTVDDRNERLNVLVRHEMNTNGRPTNRTLLAELISAAGV